MFNTLKTLIESISDEKVFDLAAEGKKEEAIKHLSYGNSFSVAQARQKEDFFFSTLQIARRSHRNSRGAEAALKPLFLMYLAAPSGSEKEKGAWNMLDMYIDSYVDDPRNIKNRTMPTAAEPTRTENSRVGERKLAFVLAAGMD